MGYNTTFCFGLMEGNREQYDAMLEDIDKIIGDNEASLNECVNAKWYNHEEDLEKISKKYPDIAFSVEGDGEDFDDHWIQYWHNGKSYSEKIHFKSYNEIKHLI